MMSKFMARKSTLQRFFVLGKVLRKDVVRKSPHQSFLALGKGF